MHTRPYTRRKFIDLMGAGFGAALVPPSRLLARTAPSRVQPLFKGTPLETNKVAAHFERLPGHLLAPDPILVTDAGPHRLSEIKGRATIVSLWADWCVPCLAEVHDLDLLRARHAGASFEVLTLLQGSKLDLQGAHDRLKKAGAPHLPVWVEPMGYSIVEALGTPAGAKGFSLPCNILIDRHGRIRGRAFGTPVESVPASSKPSSSGQTAFHNVTAWSIPDGDAFAAALAGGILDRI